MTRRKPAALPGEHDIRKVMQPATRFAETQLYRVTVRRKDTMERVEIYRGLTEEQALAKVAELRQRYPAGQGGRQSEGLKLTIRLPGAQHRKLRALAAAQGVPVAEVAREAMARGLMTL